MATTTPLSPNRKPDLDLSALLKTPIQTPLSSDLALKYLTKPPFLPLPQALNLRTISYPPNLSPNYIFRSGVLSHIPLSSLLTLKTTYKITTIFDLRTLAERTKSPTPQIEGIEVIWVPSINDAGGAPKREILKEFLRDGAEKVVVRLYEEMLETHRDIFKGVFERLRDCGLGKAGGGGALLFHCTAGKDRTGVLAALILGLVGAPRDVIAQDYAMTRIGIESAREQLLSILLEQMGCGIEEPGMEEMCGVKAETMVRFLERMEEKWGGVEGYVRMQLGFGEQDVNSIRENLRVGER